MTSYKKMALEFEEKLNDTVAEMALMKQQLEAAEQRLLDEICLTMGTDEAKEVLRVFATRSRSRDELLMLIRACAKL